MKIVGVLTGLAALLVLMPGCPYETDVPLVDPGQYQIDPQLIGTWSGDNDSLRVVIFPFNATEYYIEVQEIGDEETGRVRAFVFDVGGQHFFHINDLVMDAMPKGYYFAHFELVADSLLSIHMVEDEIIPESLGSDPEGLMGFIESHLDDPKLYDSGGVLQRVKSD